MENSINCPNGSVSTIPDYDFTKILLPNIISCVFFYLFKINWYKKRNFIYFICNYRLLLLLVCFCLGDILQKNSKNKK